MNYPVLRQLTYISPSTFMKWADCQYRVYLTRLAGLPYIPYQQGLAAAIGSSFDAHVKEYIAKKRCILSNTTILDIALQSVDKDHRSEAIPKGRELAKIYIEEDFCQEFINYNGDLHLERELYGHHENIPILGRIDMILGEEPFDWKTRGFGTPDRRTYPRKGYCKRFDYDLKRQRLLEQPCGTPDPKIFLEDIDKKWAVQQVFYNWLLRRREHSAVIIEICSNKDKISFARHEHRISKAFKQQTLEQLQKMWERITDQMYYANIMEPQPCKRICMAYGVICEVAHKCKYFNSATTRGEFAHA